MFKKYSSLENAYRSGFIEKCHTLCIGKWCLTEKIHGANFSFVIDSDLNVTPAKRTGVIEKNDRGVYDFYGCTEVVERYIDTMKAMKEADFPNAKSIQVFGELHGKGIQREVNYGEKDFIAFDIYVYEESLDDGTTASYFVPFSEACLIFFNYELPYTVREFEGSLTECLEVSPEFTSTLCDDPAEGWVIRPLNENAYLQNGSRAIIKNKSKAFSERKASKHAHVPVKLTENQQKAFDDLCSYLTHNRLMNVVSKIGGITQKQFGKVMGLFVQDALKEFERDEYSIDTETRQVIMKLVQNEASNVVREDWLNILDKETENV